MSSHILEFLYVGKAGNVDIVAVQSSDATGILAALHQAVEKGLNINMSDLHPNHKGTPSLIMANIDGASVNFGSNQEL